MEIPLQNFKISFALHFLELLLKTNGKCDKKKKFPRKKPMFQATNLQQLRKKHGFLCLRHKRVWM